MHSLTPQAKWLQPALQHTDTWMNHTFPPPRKKKVMRDSRSFKLDLNRRRRSIRGGFLWYHLHRQQKRLPSTAWWIPWQKLLATSFLLRQFPRPLRTASLSNNTMMDRYDKSPMIIWGDICKGTPALYINGLLSSSLSHVPSTDVSHPLALVQNFCWSASKVLIWFNLFLSAD